MKVARVGKKTVKKMVTIGATTIKLSVNAKKRFAASKTTATCFFVSLSSIAFFIDSGDKMAVRVSIC